MTTRIPVAVTTTGPAAMLTRPAVTPTSTVITRTSMGASPGEAGGRGHGTSWRTW